MGERENNRGQLIEENEKKEEKEVVKDVEKGEMSFEEEVVETNNQRGFPLTSLQRLNSTNPLRIVLDGGTRVATPSPSLFPQPPLPSHLAQPGSTPTPLVSSSSKSVFFCLLLTGRSNFFFNILYVQYEVTTF